MDQLLEQSLDRALDPRRPLEHVLVATDLSPGSNLALDRALLLPFAREATLTAIHVCHDLDGPAASSRKEELDDLVTDAAERAGLRPGDSPRVATVMATDRAPDDAIASHAIDLDADLIVVGRHGGRQLRGLLVGSTLGRLLPRASVPVLVVARPAAAHYRRPLAALDTDASGHPMLETLLRVSSPDLQRVDVLHVARSGALPLDDARLAVERANHFYLDGWRAAGVAQAWCVTAGAPAEVILTTARTLGVDLIGIGTHGREKAARWILGSTAEKVLTAAACDVLVARARG